MGEQCRCIYNEQTHPECERNGATMLVALSDDLTAPMCEWCAQDWHRRHPGMEILRVA